MSSFGCRTVEKKEKKVTILLSPSDLLEVKKLFDNTEEKLSGFLKEFFDKQLRFTDRFNAENVRGLVQSLITLGHQDAVISAGKILEEFISEFYVYFTYMISEQASNTMVVKPAPSRLFMIPYVLKLKCWSTLFAIIEETGLLYGPNEEENILKNSVLVGVLARNRCSYPFVCNRPYRDRIDKILNKVEKRGLPDAFDSAITKTLERPILDAEDHFPKGTNKRKVSEEGEE